MRLRGAELRDAAGLTEVLAAAFKDYVAGIGRAWPGPHEWMEDRIAAGDITQAEDGSGLLGLIVLSQDANARTTTIDMLAVAEAAQGQGVGRKLLDYAESRARAAGHHSLHLHTVAKYDHLTRYYARHGFTISHHGPRPKGDDGHPRAFMVKTLEAQE